MRVIVNTSPLIVLDRIGQLDLLRDLFAQVVRPQAVTEELREGEKRYGPCRALSGCDWITSEPDPPEMALRKELGAGETAVLALALKTGADLVVLDDLQARLVAAQLHIPVTGTLGILRAAFEAGHLSDLQDALRELTKVGFHVSEGLLKAMLRGTADA